MWAAAPFTFGPDVQTIGIAAIATKPRWPQPPLARRIPLSTATAISAGAKRGRRSTSLGASEEELGCVGHAVLNALQPDSEEAKSKPPKTNKIGSKQWKRKQGEPQQTNQKGGKDLSGSDVLLALQKASARKSRRKKKEVAVPVTGSRTSRGEDTGDFRNVRPLRIRSDWGIRLEELEKRIQEFGDVKL